MSLRPIECLRIATIFKATPPIFPKHSPAFNFTFACSILRSSLSSCGHKVDYLPKVFWTIKARYTLIVHLGSWGYVTYFASKPWLLTNLMLQYQPIQHHLISSSKVAALWAISTQDTRVLEIHRPDLCFYHNCLCPILWHKAPHAPTTSMAVSVKVYFTSAGSPVKPIANLWHLHILRRNIYFATCPYVLSSHHHSRAVLIHMNTTLTLSSLTMLIDRFTCQGQLFPIPRCHLYSIVIV